MSINNALHYFGETSQQDGINKNTTTLVSGIQNPINVNQNLDSFERLRVSLPQTVYEYGFQCSKASLIWAEKIGGSGVATFQPNTSSITLSTGITRTDAQVKLVGYGDSENGIFLGQDNTGIFVLLRSNVTGTVSDARKVYQADWNIDKMDGRGQSGILLDITKAQIFEIQLQFLGVGLVKCGLDVNGKLYFIHQFLNANIISKTYMTTANLPIHYSITDGTDFVIRQTFQYMRYRHGKGLQILITFNMNDDTVNELEQICASVITETAGDEDIPYLNSVSTGTVPALIVAGAYNPILSIRPRPTFVSGVVNRSQIIGEEIDLLVSTANRIVDWKLVYDGTLTGANFTAPSANTNFELDLSATAITGGETIKEGYAVSSVQTRSAISKSFSTKVPITLDIDGLNPKNLSLVATAIGGNTDVYASLSVRQLY